MNEKERLLQKTCRTKAIKTRIGSKNPEICLPKTETPQEPFGKRSKASSHLKKTAVHPPRNSNLTVRYHRN